MLSEQRMTRETRNWKWPNKWRHYYLRTCALRQGHTERYNDFFDLTLLHLLSDMIFHGPLARCAKLPVVHAPGMAGTFSPPLWVSDPDMHHGTCVAHVPPYMPGSLPSGFLWSPWWGKRSWHSRCMRKPQFSVSGKRPMEVLYHVIPRSDPVIGNYYNITIRWDRLLHERFQDKKFDFKPWNQAARLYIVGDIFEPRTNILTPGNGSLACCE